MRGKEEIKVEEKIEYSPKELEEVERILNRLSIETLESDFTTTSIPSETKTDEDFTEDQTYLSESSEDEIPAFEEGLEEVTDFEEISDEEEIMPADITGPEEFPDEIEFEEPEESGEDQIQDITDIIHDIDDSGQGEPPIEPVEIQDFGELEPDDLLSEDFSLPTDIETEPGTPVEPEVEPPIYETPDFGIPEVSDQEPAEETPEELDLGMLDKDIGEIQTEDEAFGEAAGEILEDIPEPEFEKAGTDLDESELLIDENFLDEYDKVAEEIAAEEPAEAEIPIPETEPEELIDDEFKIQTEEIPSVDESQIPEPSDDIMGQADDFSALDIADLETADEPIADEPASDEIPQEIQEPDLSIDFEKFDQKPADTASVFSDIDIAEPGEAPPPPLTDEDRKGIDLSNSELKQLKKVIQFFHPNLTKVVKDVIINDRLPSQDIKDLVNMLLGGGSEQEIKDFLENKLKTTIDISPDTLRRRKIITARPEYTKEGRERQKRLFKITKIFSIAAVIAFLVTIFSYQYIYKPVMAKKNIAQGVLLIKKSGAPALQKQRDFREAENIFDYVNKHYMEEYIYGYNEYAKAYLQNKEYDLALKKLNKAFEIDGSNVDTLNNLGFFYSKLPEHKFRQIKPNLKKYYYSKIKPAGPVDSQVDVAIDFYRKSLNVDPENVTALYGIGNAYISQGQNRKAREYFENIIKIDKKSVIGYSGLLNLYIERNAFPEIISIHSDLKYKDKLSKLPSPLLAKLAAYYLSKVRTDEKNIRIDYGVQSPVIKDMNDNPYPAVRDVLNALSSRDMDYPPLFILFAKLSENEGNLNLMKRNLLTALEKEPNYFAANLLLGKYYYMTNEPVDAYRYCKKAIQTYLSPPEFTNEDFFHETENIGHAYAIEGNIFYYYFDKIKFRFGDEFEEDNVQEQSEKMANFEIAQEKYEKALTEKYKTSEIIYNLGRIYYIKGLYEKAVTTWLNLYEDFLVQPELMLALGNAFYHQNNLEAGKGEFLKVISVFEDKEEKILGVNPGRMEHTRIYQTLSTAYNNLGAVYQIQNKETKSNISYWRSIEYAKKIERENEFARVNLARAFKPGRENVLPILDETIPESIDAYKLTVR